MLHTIDATPQSVHWGYFDTSLSPIAVVESGDIVMIEAVTHQAGDAPDLMMDERIRTIYSAIPMNDRCPGVHLMTGPIFVKNAKPGDMLEVRYMDMRVRNPYGSNLAASWGFLFDEFGQKERVTIYKADLNSNLAEAIFAYTYPGKYISPGAIINPNDCCRESALCGVKIPVRPHLGTAGVCPDLKGRISTIPPGSHGGNIDNWRIGAGSTMYYPVAVDGAIFSIGDPHISQGDGEISGTAIEASLDVIFQVFVRKDFSFPSPLLETPLNWIVHGFDDDLNKAMKNASMDMLYFLTNIKGLSRNDAYSLMSVIGDYGITQVVDQRLGVHVKVPRGVLCGNVFDPEAKMKV